ncbi:hypothetical protein GCK72_016030 [Caenorhabditis remanei]|uniref:Phosphoacetylglucosamine mutase n=1 Tax=Caenorhabditis remanei TaxID=31234 RepID=A0A6A5GYT6_CAERE|nr:hypothetical protein GCK72_016030 [Caenorhabditis remanei]KAF1759563.1 hypothetical protein GCK72_016030 [Caenorhabditis remanei]
MADPVFPQQFSRAGNTTHTGDVFSIPQEEQLAYGTAGFRFRAEKLPFIVFRCAYVASLRARQLDSAIGVMITASHNPAADNGVKLVDPSGDMLSQQWEKYATEIVNATDEDLPSAVRALEKQMSQVEKSRISSGQTKNARVVCGMDTRLSGPHLISAARAGSALFNVQFVDVGIVTTPMLHYTVKSFNEPDFAEPTNQGYYRAISSAFRELYGITQEPEGSRYQPHVIVDCANGVGAPRLREFIEHIPRDMLEIELRNERGELNHDCGADFVKISQKMPTEFGNSEEGKEGKCVSFDGDADRILYFRGKGAESGDSECVELFDGDRIAVLFAMYLKEQLDEFAAIKTNYRLTMGIIQTAYANGASTRFIRDSLKIETVIVPTGVKHLHEAASEFDVGIYFEANGHGTVVFSEQFNSAIRRAPSSIMCIRRLALFSRVINETVGDAFADLMAIEMCLRHFGWSMDDWNQKLYTDVPNIQIKVPVDDRSIFKTTNAEQTLLKPDGIQKRIDEDVAKFKSSRAFIRPSGTENIVRIYAEADTVENTLLLGKSLEQVVLSIRSA